MKGLTEKQQSIFNFLVTHQKKVGVAPSVREVGDQFSITVKSASDHIKAIEKKGYIKIIPRIARGIVIL